jgi:hypothetical protein
MSTTFRLSQIQDTPLPSALKACAKTPRNTSFERKLRNQPKSRTLMGCMWCNSTDLSDFKHIASQMSDSFVTLSIAVAHDLLSYHPKYRRPDIGDSLPQEDIPACAANRGAFSFEKYLLSSGISQLQIDPVFSPTILVLSLHLIPNIDSDIGETCP